MINPIKIYKKTLQDAKWYIHWDANRWDKPFLRNDMSRPYVIGYCPVCESQRYLSYLGQTNADFVFECSFCKEMPDIKVNGGPNV